MTYELVITREGTLLFPEIGPISDAGLNFEELREQIEEIRSMPTWNKSDLVQAFHCMVPEFSHLEIGKHLDSRM